MHEIFGGELAKFHVIFEQFMARDSAETSAEASVDLAEASVSAESHFRAIRSFTIGKAKHTCLLFRVALFYETQ